jgi:two-component system sensor histidine kinase ChiS
MTIDNVEFTSAAIGPADLAIPEQGKYAVLYVDDEEQALKYLRKGLEKEFRILTAADVSQALAVLEQEGTAIGVVITDQRMPGKSGVDLLAEIRQRWPAVVRILITAFTDVESAVAAVNSGAVYKYIIKPADFALLRQIISEALAVHRETIHRDALAQTLRQLEEQRRATQKAEAAREALHQRLVAASREAGRAEVATGILHNVGNVLNSMNVSASVVNNTLQESRIGNLLKSLAMIEEHAGDLANFISTDERGQRLPGYLIKLGPVLREEQAIIAEAMSVLNRSIQHVMHVVGVQQSHAKELILEESVFPESLMEDAVQVNQLAIDDERVTLIREYAKVPAVLLDQHRVLQILINLIGNAVRALGGGTGKDKLLKLRITTTPDVSSPSIRFEVIDNGLGIPADLLTRIFTFGFTTRKDGHGFGLHSAANAAKEMGGALTVASDGPGLGATFALELPLRIEPKELVPIRQLERAAS